MFGEETLARAIDLIDGNKKFDGMPEEDLNPLGFKTPVTT